MQRLQRLWQDVLQKCLYSIPQPAAQQTISSSATKIARAMVTMYGMSDTFGMMCLATVENQYLDGRAGLICGEDTAGHD